MNILEGLNEKQKEAVLTTKGPLLIFAGAGSGKTKTITHRILNLIINEGVDPSNILAVTFTKKASEEMLNRIISLMKEFDVNTTTRPTIGTFHSIAAMILRREPVADLGINKYFSIYDADDSEALIKDIMLEQDIDIKQFKPKAIYHIISRAKNDMVSAKNFALQYSGFIEDIVSAVYEEYEKTLSKLNAVDFSGILFKLVELFDKHPEILEKYQELYKYIHIDEYQDTNHVQYVISKNLAAKYRNICVVGDDDQGIYAWRGADIKNILSFEKDFPEVKTIKLEQNYRSTRNIITAAVSVINQNNNRVEKQLWTEKDSGEVLTIYQARDDKDEATFVVEEIRRRKSQGTSLNDIAILYRTNYQSRSIEEALLQYGIPYKLIGGFRFYERKEIKDIISYLRVLNNPKDNLSLQRIINVPARKIGPKTLQILAEISDKYDMSYLETLLEAYSYINNSDSGRFEENDLVLLNSKFSSIIDIFGKLFEYKTTFNVVDLIEQILFLTRYVESFDDGSPTAESKKENIVELKTVASIYVTRYPKNSLEQFLSDIALIEQGQSKLNDKNQDTVTLMTLHTAKGLEFPVVFMIGMEEGLFPHSRSFTNEEELEEERRLCYVGITRAKEKLYLTFAETRYTREGLTSRVPSRFLQELPRNVCSFYSWVS